MKYAEDEVLRLIEGGMTPNGVRALIASKQSPIQSDYFGAVAALDFLISRDAADLRSGRIREAAIGFLVRLAELKPEFQPYLAEAEASAD